MEQPRSFLTRVFFSPTELRPRAGWRLLVHFTLMFSILIVLSVGVAIAYLFGASLETVFLVNQLTLFVAINSSTPLARRFLDRRSFVSLGLTLKPALPDLAAGFAVAAVVMGAIFLAEWAFGWLTVDSFAWQGLSWPQIAGSLAFWLFIFVLGGWQEELLCRGYWLQNIAEGLNLPWGLFISSVLFALLHLSNPNVSWTAIVGLFAAGYFLAYGYLRTRQLWLSIGLHIGWNFFEGNIFGFQVSGLDTFRLIQPAVSGPELITGGAFGPEAGLIVLPAMLLGVALIEGYARWRRRE